MFREERLDPLPRILRCVLIERNRHERAPDERLGDPVAFGLVHERMAGARVGHDVTWDVGSLEGAGELDSVAADQMILPPYEATTGQRRSATSSPGKIP